MCYNNGCEQQVALDGLGSGAVHGLFKILP